MTAFIARLGVNPLFIAFMAHCWFAAFIVLAFGGSGWAIAAVLVISGIKEFWFDATYEVPKQTTFDNVTDFAGYAMGAWIGALVAIFIAWIGG